MQELSQSSRVSRGRVSLLDVGFATRWQQRNTRTFGLARSIWFRRASRRGKAARQLQEYRDSADTCLASSSSTAQLDPIDVTDAASLIWSRRLRRCRVRCECRRRSQQVALVPSASGKCWRDEAEGSRSSTSFLKAWMGWWRVLSVAVRAACDLLHPWRASRAG